MRACLNYLESMFGFRSKTKCSSNYYLGADGSNGKYIKGFWVSKDDKIFLSFGGENNDSYNNWI
nr:MAG TPA: hypothetical protein [Caudoviricetes sp.]